MKKLLAILILGLAGSIHAQTLGTDTGLQISITAPLGSQCTTTLLTSCLKGYTATITPPVAGSTPIVVPIGLVSTYTWRPGGDLYCGTWSISLVANWLNASGVATPSTAVTGTAVEPCPFVASPVTGVSVKPVP